MSYLPKNTILMQHNVEIGLLCNLYVDVNVCLMPWSDPVAEVSQHGVEAVILSLKSYVMLL